MLDLTIDEIEKHITPEIIEVANNLQDNTYKNLENGAKKIFNKEILEMFWECKYEHQEEYNKDITGIDWINIDSKYEIVEDCKDNVKYNFKCMCGKEHLKYCNVIGYRGQHFLLGSECIKTLERYIRIKAEKPLLAKKIEKWVKIINDKANTRNKKPCVVCGKKLVGKYKYQDPRRRDMCKLCVVKDYTKCVECKKMFYNPKDNCFAGSTLKVRCKRCYGKKQGWF